jgi:hypothetical protein
MRSSVFIALGLVAAYILGSLAPLARAHEEAPVPVAVPAIHPEQWKQLIAVQREQAEALKQLVALQKTAQGDREEADSLRTIARALSSEWARNQREQTEALTKVATAVERLKR